MKNTLYHVWLFSFGLMYYLIVPALVVASRIWEEYPGMDNLYNYYKDDYLFGYFLLVFFVTIPFFIGAYLPLRYFKETRSLNQILISSRGLFLISMPILLYSQYLILSNRDLMFHGYLAGTDLPFIGTFATINMLFLFLYFYNKFGAYSSRMNIILILVLVELCIVALGLGTRMYAMVTIFSVLTFLLDQRVISMRKMLLVFSVIVVFILAVGIWRMGDTNISFDQLVYIGVAEPTFTWITAISMYDLNELPLLSFPANYLSSFINFIPLSVFPNKTEFISELSLNHDAPWGATSVLLSLISNFGILGSMIVVFSLGFLLSQVRLHWKTAFGQAYYFCICGIIPFQLFRDDFGVVNKQLFSNFLLLPMIIFFVHRIMSLLATRPNQCSSNGDR